MQFNIPVDKDFKIKVGAHEIKVVFVPGDSEKLNQSGEKYKIIYGCWEDTQNTIYINKDQPESLRISTLLHELIHVFENYFDVKIAHHHLNLISELMAETLMTNFKKGSK